MLKETGAEDHATKPKSVNRVLLLCELADRSSSRCVRGGRHGKTMFHECNNIPLASGAAGGGGPETYYGPSLTSSRPVCSAKMRQSSFGMRQREEGRKEAEITNSQQTVTANRDDKMGWTGRGRGQRLLERGRELQGDSHDFKVDIG